MARPLDHFFCFGVKRLSGAYRRPGKYKHKGRERPQYTRAFGLMYSISSVSV